MTARSLAEAARAVADRHAEQNRAAITAGWPATLTLLGRRLAVPAAALALVMVLT